MSKAIPQIDIMQRTILDNLSTAVVLLDHELCVQYVNPAGENLFHISNKRAQSISLGKIMFITDRLCSALSKPLMTNTPLLNMK